MQIQQAFPFFFRHFAGWQALSRHLPELSLWNFLILISNLISWELKIRLREIRLFQEIEKNAMINDGKLRNEAGRGT